MKGLKGIAFQSFQSLHSLQSASISVMSIVTLNTDEQAIVRHAGKVLRECLAHVSALAKSGVTTLQLDAAAEEFIRSHSGCTPAFLGYQGYPNTLCTSVNDACVHGLPGSYQLREGDIVSLDCGVMYEEFYTDAARTVAVGTVTPLAQRLLATTAKALDCAISIVQGGVRVGDISATIQEVAESAGFHPVRVLTGHGLGRSLHQPPEIPNIGKKGSGPRIPAGAFIAIEPIIAVGAGDAREDDDGWTYRTLDHSLCAHEEHCLLVTDDGCEVIA